MIERKDLETRETRDLAPYAAHSSLSKGRVWREAEHSFRTCFQRDRERILHSTAFRRLEYKTQVFVNHEGDHYRTRLTHTLEVAQIARSVSRILRLNEDLVEAISLAHDLGHGPFGHAGERALRGMMKTEGGFEHNQQSLRIVELLEDNYPDFPGLNLTHEVLAGMKKHGQKDPSRPKLHFPVYLEAQLADIADEIAYDSHDVEDGLRSGLIHEDELAQLDIWKRVTAQIKKKYSSISEPHRRRLAIRRLISHQIDDLIHESTRNIEKHEISSLQELSKLSVRMIDFSKDLKELKKPWRKFLSEKLYNHYRVVRMTEKGERLIKQIFEVYLDCPAQLPPNVIARFKRDGIHRSICDYIAGMTDRFAQDEYQRLFEPYERV